ncbi:MAG: dihydroorotate dehydrogenase-like protein [Calothrix sp. C42_A2020_038]|nr:dihydroorotate dehydrogenase-like protein [Calothrix sp. C42_A2020_038]
MNLTTKYMGLTLKSPIVPSASPLSEDIDNIKRIEDAGAGAVVMHSLFEEQLNVYAQQISSQIILDDETNSLKITDSSDTMQFRVNPSEYLEHIHKAKEMVDIPIIASLNGASLGGWISYAQLIEQAGADALELNMYYVPTDINLTSVHIEQNYIDILNVVKANVKIPVAVKLSPYWTNMANMAKRMDDAGADALVLFNRFYQPDINLKKLQVEPNIILSEPQAKCLPMRWIAILYGQLKTNFAATSGIHTGNDVVKMLLAGADVTMLCSALLIRGIEYMRTLEQELREWMEEHEFNSIEQIKGILSQRNCVNPSAFERAQYMSTLSTYKPEWIYHQDTSYYFG